MDLNHFHAVRGQVFALFLIPGCVTSLSLTRARLHRDFQPDQRVGWFGTFVLYIKQRGSEAVQLQNLSSSEFTSLQLRSRQCDALLPECIAPQWMTQRKKSNWLWNLLWVFTSQQYLWPDLSRTRALPQRSSLMEGSGSQWTRPSYITVWNYSRAGTGLLFWRDVLLLFSFSSSSVVNKPSLLARTLMSSPHFFPLSWNDPAVATATEQKAPIDSALRF